MTPSEHITYATTLITCKKHDGSICSGTGFIMYLCMQENSCIPVLITNRHVVNNGLSCRFSICKKNDDGTPNDREIVDITVQDMSVWLFHPNPDTDLCCLPVGAAINELEERQGIKLFYTPLTKDWLPTDEDLKTFSALEEVVMVGYPRALVDNYNHKPILRRGITATNIKNNYENKPEFMVDMACFPGSSGSPVFILQEGMYSVAGSAFVGNRIKFLGVLYAGPMFNFDGRILFSNTPEGIKTKTAIPMNLGMVIKASEILAFEPLILQQTPKE